MIYRFNVAIGDCRSEGRQPSHDGEYLAVYYRQGHPDEWIANDNGGGTYSHLFGVWDACADNNASEEELAEAKAIDAEIEEGVRTGCGDPADPTSLAVRDAMIEWGWLTEEEADEEGF